MTIKQARETLDRAIKTARQSVRPSDFAAELTEAADNFQFHPQGHGCLAVRTASRLAQHRG